MAALAFAASHADDAPNVVLIFTDSTRADYIGHWNPDSPLVDTPNLDSLGKDSLALWDLLLDAGYHADGLYLGLGIGEYSDASGDAARAFDQRLTAIGQMAIALRHEINNDLQEIVGSAHLIRGGLEAAAPQLVRQGEVLG